MENKTVELRNCTAKTRLKHLTKKKKENQPLFVFARKMSMV